MSTEDRLTGIYEAISNLSETEQNRLILNLVEITKKRRETKLKELAAEKTQLEKDQLDLDSGIQKLNDRFEICLDGN